jgi:hypothetical protein
MKQKGHNHQQQQQQQQLGEFLFFFLGSLHCFCVFVFWLGRSLSKCVFSAIPIEKWVTGSRPERGNLPFYANAF